MTPLHLDGIWLSHPDWTNAVTVFDLTKRGLGLLITVPSPDERSTAANAVLRVFREEGYNRLSLTAFEVVAAQHFGQSDRLRHKHKEVLLIKDLGALTQAQQDAIAVIDPTRDIASSLEHIIDARRVNHAPTVVTTEYDVAELETQFSSRLGDVIRRSLISVDLRDGGLHVDQL